MGMGESVETLLGLASGIRTPSEPRSLWRRLRRFARAMQDAPARADAQRSRLLWRDELGAARALAIDGAAYVGRGKDCDVTIPDTLVSKRHFRVWLQGDQWWIEDLHSTNGTRVNNHCLNSIRELSSGDEIEAGNVAFYFDGPVEGRVTRG